MISFIPNFLVISGDSAHGLPGGRCSCELGGADVCLDLIIEAESVRTDLADGEPRSRGGGDGNVSQPTLFCI